MDSVRDHSMSGVAPFGYPWINACSRLPMAFRSVPRPSSPLSAKASTKCPYLTLDPNIATPIAPSDVRSQMTDVTGQMPEDQRHRSRHPHDMLDALNTQMIRSRSFEPFSRQPSKPPAEDPTPPLATLPYFTVQISAADGRGQMTDGRRSAAVASPVL